MIQGVVLERPPGFETVSTDIDNAQAWVLDPFVLPTRAEIANAFEGDDALYHRRFGMGQFEVLNKEFVSALAGYLVERAGVTREKPDDIVKILEVGAGIGKLSRFLEFFFDELGENKIDLTAVDSGSNKLTGPLGSNVERMDYQEGLYMYRPGIVVCSWMPQTLDWSQAMRDTPSVQEYVLIGEENEGCCGAQWETWGNPHHLIAPIEELLEDRDKPPAEEEREVLEAKIKELRTMPAPSEADGFSRHSLEHLTGLQTDVHESLHSETVSFRRDIPS